MSFCVLTMMSMKRVTPGHVGLIEDWQGALRPYIYDDSQLVLAIPFWHRLINMRLIPVKKRYIKEFKTKDAPRGGLLRTFGLGTSGAPKADVQFYGSLFTYVKRYSELLGVAPAVLRKELARRRTFDQLVVKSLDAEFAKQAEALRSKLEETQQSLEEPEQTLESKKKAVATAKEGRLRKSETIKETNRQIEEATDAVETGRRSLAAAKKKIKGLPSVLKKVQRSYDRVQGRYEKFRGGPLSAYLKHQPVREVPDDDEDDMQVHATLDDEE
eukprot:s737_g2.t1